MWNLKQDEIGYEPVIVEARSYTDGGLLYCLAALVNFQFSTIRDCKENYEAERSDWKNKLEKKAWRQNTANDCDEQSPSIQATLQVTP